MVTFAMLSRSFVASLWALGAVALSAQETLSLDEALRLARENNGNLRAAVLDVEAARSRVRQARATFLPIVTPDAGFQYRRQEVLSGLRSTFKTDDFFSGISANWRLLDAGQREFALRGTEANFRTQDLQRLQTLRTTLVGVHSAYYEVLRAQQLRAAAEASVQRAQATLDQVIARIRVQDLAEKEELQARADLLNAEVALLLADNRVSISEADFRALIGWPDERELPALVELDFATMPTPPADLETLISEAMVQRADLLARERGLEAQDWAYRRLRTEAGPTWSVDANYERRFGPTAQETTNLTALVSVPLYDGGRSREAANEVRLSRQASEADLDQARRSARSEIEAAYKVLTQNAQRLRAASLARDAARRNFEAAQGAFRSGAADLVSVVTAQASLVTAEANVIEALVDVAIADVRLRLAAGRPIPGEEV